MKLDLKKISSLHNGNTSIGAQSNNGGCIAFNRRMNFLNFDSSVGGTTENTSDPGLREMLDRTQHLQTIIDKRWQNI